jgi:hypothetical protein
MSLILTWTSSSASTPSLSPTIWSAVALSDILTGAAIALGGLIFLLALRELASTRDSWNEKKAAVLQAFILPLIVTFCALVVFATARFL